MSGSSEGTTRRRWPVVLLISVLTLVIIPIAVGVATPTVSAWLHPVAVKHSCSDTGGLTPITPTAVTSSGDLTDEQSGVIHAAALTIDGDARTAWAEDKPGLGSGSWLQWAFPANTDLQLVCIVNGYAKTRSVYESNATIRDLSATSGGQTVTSTLPQKSLADFAGTQSVSFTAGHTASLRITITSAYAATGDHPAQDTCVSEIYFYAKS